MSNRLRPSLGRPVRVTEIEGRPRRDAITISIIGVALWAAVIFLGRTWALLLESQGHHLVLYTPPILGGYRVGGLGSFWLPVTVCSSLVAVLPAAAKRLAWPATLATGAAGSLLWWVGLALIDGPSGLTNGLHWQADFADVAPRVASSPTGYLRTFVADLPRAGIQVRAHPPGLPLILGSLERIGLSGEGWATFTVLLSAAAGVVAVLVAVREIVGEPTARRVLPFLVLAPAATWIAISFDALYLGVAAWFVTVLVMSMKRQGRRADLLAAVAGVLAAAAIMLSYGLVLMGCLAIAATIRLRRLRPLVIASVVAFLVVLAFVPLGFWWIAGFEATKEQYFGFGLDRPYGFFILNNFSAWALAIGPATVVALARLRDRRLWIFVGGGLAAVVIADLSGMSNAEVERIWLPFTIWVIPAAAVLATSRLALRFWLAAQAASAIVLAAFISPYW